MDMPKWMSELVEKGGSVTDYLTLWKEIQGMEREERAGECDLKRVEMEREIRMRELEIKEKEIAVQQALGVAAPVTSKDQKYSKLPKFIEGQDPDVFLKSFEKLATLHKWAKSEWPVRIVPLLSGKALEAYSLLSDADGGKDESFREFRVKLERYLAYWCECESVGNSYEKLLDLMLREQLLQTCSKDLWLWVNEHKPKSAHEVVDLAESHQVAHKTESLVSDGAFKMKPQSGNNGGQTRGLQKDLGKSKDFRKPFMASENEDE
ncbi:unnamed protein product [Mytilus coruscus]|uniref:SCAN box domain-containing protein n=1 Tax=Mytilus coruscus TaxID=42192 RepID=A0A6J8DPU2_MYTCO|nr:unnamed protein product [Mytilus coruscus]